MRFFPIFRLILITSVLFLYSCINTNPAAPNSTNTQFVPKGLYGRILNVNGQGVFGTKLMALKIGDLASNLAKAQTLPTSPSILDSVYSDSNGYYSFSSLPSGIYNIDGDFSKREYVVFIQNVEYKGGQTVQRIEPATLKKSGRVSGSVKLFSNDHGGVFCYVAGTSLIAISDKIGNYVIYGIPEGTYSVTFMKDGYLSDKIDSVIIVAEKQTNLLQKSLGLDPSYPPNPPTNLVAIYDTLNGKVQLKWNRVHVSDLDGYIIYRNDTSTSNPSRLIKELIKDTVFIDTVFTTLTDPQNYNFVYRIKSQDKSANNSTIYSDPVTISVPSPTLVKTFIAFQSKNTINDSASINDSVTIIANYSNNGRNNNSISWYLNTDSIPFRQKTAKLRSGSDTITIFSNNQNLHNLKLKVTDDGHTDWTDSLKISYIIDAPIVNAGKDDSAAINARYLFNGIATQKFGTIRQYKWDYNGDGIWDDSSSVSGVGSFIYKSQGIYNAIFTVVDDDNNIIADTTVIKVTNLPPFIKIVRPDTTVSIMDNISFYAFATDTDGVVKSYSWDFENDGAYEIVNQNGNTSHAYISSGIYKAILKVADDDNKLSFDTVHVTVLIDPPIVRIGNDTTTSINAALAFKPFISQQFGTISIYKWDFNGDGVFEDSSFITANTSHTFTSAGSYQTILEARDDDGNSGFDTIVVTVLNQPPVITKIKTDTTISINDTVVFFANATDADGTIKNFSWDFDGNGIFDFVGTNANSNHAYTNIGVYNAILKVLDDDNKATLDTVTVNVILDPPIVNLGNDTTISINSTITFQAKVNQQFGNILKYKWDFNGDGVWDDSSTTNANVSHAYTTEAIYRSVSYVSDDDGNVGLDTMIVNVTNLAPSITFIKNDTTISINDTVVFTALASDPDGTIKNYSWDFDGNGSFDYIGLSANSSHAYTTVGFYNAIIQVLDDDNKAMLDTVKINVVLDRPIVNIGPDTTISINSTINFKATTTQQFGNIIIYKWDYNGDGILDDSSATTPNGTYIYTHEAIYNAILYATDDDGNIGIDTIRIAVTNSAPSILSIRSDTLISINDNVSFSASATDIDGTIKSYSWDFDGNGTFDYTGLSSSSNFAYPNSGTFRAILKVTDDDDKPKLDTVNITVIIDAPTVNIGRDTTIAINQSMQLTANATQQFGSIVKYYWDVEADGTWNDSTLTPTYSISFSSGGHHKIVAKVVDDDNNIGYDTIDVWCVTFIGGVLSSNTTFIPSNNPYLLTADLQIGNSRTLTILPGTLIYFKDSTEILIKGGSIIANGNTLDSIKFIPLKTISYNTTFLKFEGTNLNNSQISYSIFQRGNEAIRIGDESEHLQAPVKNSGILIVQNSMLFKTTITTDGYDATSSLKLKTCHIDSSIVYGTYPRSDSIVLEECLLTNTRLNSDSYNRGIILNNCTGTGLTFQVGCCGANFVIRNSQLNTGSISETNSYGFVRIYNSTLNNFSLNLSSTSLDMQRTTISLQTGQQVRTSGGLIKQCRIIGNMVTTSVVNSGAITIDSVIIENSPIAICNYSSSVQITNCNFNNNSTYCIQNLANSNITATNNYWGTSIEAEVKLKIYDSEDNLGVGTVLYAPFRTTAIPNLLP
jgi:PKD repeat protein